MPMNDPHASLVQGAAAGDGPALQSLLVRHLPSLEAYVRLQAGAAVRARESLHDLVQSVCVEVLRDAGRFEYRGEQMFRQWLFRQALHKIINKNRFHGAARRALAREVDPGAGGSEVSGYADCYRTILTPSREAVAHESWTAFERAFDQLPEDYREAITLRRIVGLGYGEIAEAMQRSEGAVRNLVHRGIARLSSLLEAPGSPG
jgi:RNA polymerase sigma-70 factor (ECF subfamily)